MLQNPGDYFIHEHVCDEAPVAALEDVGLAAMGMRNPRDLSGGERQRLALAIVAGAGDGDSPIDRPAVLALDDAPPTSVIAAIRADDAVIDIWSVTLGRPA